MRASPASRFVCLMLCMTAVVASVPADTSQNPETLAERSQSAARAVLDRAVEAIGGAAALRDIKSVRLRLEGETWPRLQMTTPVAPFEAGKLQETLTLDLANARMMLEQEGSGAGFENHNTIVISSGQGTNYDYRARTAT